MVNPAKKVLTFFAGLALPAYVLVSGDFLGL